MSEKRFVIDEKTNYKDYPIILDTKTGDWWVIQDTMMGTGKLLDLLNEQQELIEELQVSDEMGWKRAERFEKKCPKELHNKKMYIKRLEYKVQKFKEENEQLRKQCFELEKDYLIETSDISDKIYLDDEIKELKQKYGVKDE